MMKRNSICEQVCGHNFIIDEKYYTFVVIFCNYKFVMNDEIYEFTQIRKE